MGKRKGMLFEAIERLDSFMAIGDKRSEAKAEAHARGESFFAFSDHKIRSHETRTGYQAVVMRFLHWSRKCYRLNRLAQVDARADKLASAYLVERMGEEKSAWTLLTERSALRCFFQSKDLAERVALPPRYRDAIVQSRQPAVRDKNIQIDHWQPLIRFLQATGLRREEVRDLLVCDVSEQPGGLLRVHVVRGKGGKTRRVPVLPGREADVLSVVEGCPSDQWVFERIPSNLDIHAIRRQYACALYEYYAGHPIPIREGGLRITDLDREAVLKVSWALGHNRIEVVVTHYLQ
jgi:integrase